MLQLILDNMSVEYHLTTRQKEVLSLVVKGWDLNEIAKQLHISHETAKSHVQNILEKTSLGTQRRLQGFVIEQLDGRALKKAQ